MQKLIDPQYLSFPFRVEVDGVKTSRRQEHIRGQIEQVLFTDPRERVFRPEFGAGVRTLVFEPNAASLRDMATQRLSSTLAEALRGEVDPETLRIEVEPPGSGEQLILNISYRLATINQEEQHLVVQGLGSHG